MPPAMKALGGYQYFVRAVRGTSRRANGCTYPAVVDMALCSGSKTQGCNLLTDQAVPNCELQISHEPMHMLLVA